MRYEELSFEVVGAAIDAHRGLGPGLVESSYQKCMERALTRRGLAFRAQVPVDVRFDGLVIERAYLADIVVDNRIVLELKAVRSILRVHEAQLRTYMKWLEIDVGYVFNFHVENLTREGMKRQICSDYLPLGASK